MLKKLSKKIVAIALCALMVISAIPLVSISAAAFEYGDYTSNSHTVFKHTEQTLAPGVEQYTNYAYTKSDNKQMVYYVTKSDLSRPDIVAQVSYMDMQCDRYGMQKLTDTVAIANAKYSNPDDPEFISKNYKVVCATNGDGYNMTTGEPSGCFVMNYKVKKGFTGPFLAIMYDGTARVGDTQAQWNAYMAENNGKGIKEAIDFFGTKLVWDGVNVGGSSSERASRTMIGVTADGKLVNVVVDGRQEPFSCGGTFHELAEIMLEAGCEYAINLDGGGSTTFMMKKEGTDECVVANRPSDGSVRSISNGFIIASTAAPSDEFDHASLSVEDEYITPGSSVAISVTGVSASGTAAVVPEDVTYSATLGTVNNGVFVSDGTEGVAKVKMHYNGTVVGETSVNVVIPDSVKFTQNIITAPYSKTVKVSLTAKYGFNEVALKAEDFVMTLDNPDAATVNGFEITACDGEISGTGIKVSLVYDSSISDTAQLVFGKGSEVIEDYENFVIPSNSTIITGYPQYGPAGANGQNEKGSLEVVDASNGKVHSGDKAVAINCDFTQLYETGYHLLNYRLGSGSLKIPANATAFGFWMYVPQDTESVYIRCNIDTTGDGSGDYMPNLIPTGLASTYTEEGWHYYNVDMSAYNNNVANCYCIQIFVSDRDGADYKYYYKNHYSVDSKFTLYIDDITVDYSSVVDDREAPIFTSVNYADQSMSDAAELNNQTTHDSMVSFGAVVREDTSKNNYTGIDVTTAKAYVDGVEVDCKYSAGTLTVEDVVLADGVHTIAFEIADMVGNLAKTHRQIKVAANEGKTYVNLVPQTPDAYRIPIGSIQYYDLKTNAIEKIDSVTTKLNLNSVSNWELEGMTTAYGFTATYEIDEITNNALITITKTGKVSATGEAVLATIPVRTWISTITNDPGYESSTPQSLWSRKIIWSKDIKISADYGLINFTDGTTGSFTSAQYQTITELYGNYAALNANGDYANKSSWHIHSVSSTSDKPATCTQSGYTGRVFCNTCGSVVDWGTIIPATGHTYEVINGKYACSSCDEILNGEYNGKEYVDGLALQGWIGDSFYVDGAKLYGLNEIDGFYYDFGDNGICEGKAKLDGFYYEESTGKYRYFSVGKVQTGDVASYQGVYFIDKNGYAVSGDVDILGYTCKFDDHGSFVSSTDSSVVDAGFSGTDVKYVFLADGTLKVGGNGEIGDYTAKGVFPAWYIKEDKDIKAIEIGNGITKIGTYAFYRCYWASTITFESNSSLKEICQGAFGLCQAVTSITLPASLEKIGYSAFYQDVCLKNVSFEEDSVLTTIETEAFNNDTALENVYIPDSVTTLGGNIFKNVSNVKLSVLRDSAAHVYAINNNLAFSLRDASPKAVAKGMCTDSVKWTVYDNGKLVIAGSGAMADYTSAANQPWAAYKNSISAVEVRNGVTSVGAYAFTDLTNAVEVVFEDDNNITKIGAMAFANTGISEINIGTNVEEIAPSAFGNAKIYVYQDTYAETFAKENNINFGIRRTSVASGSCGAKAKWAIYDDGTLVISGSGAMTDFENDKAQPWYSKRSLVKSVEIGSDITKIGNWSFAYMTGVKNIVFDENSKLETLGNASFLYMIALTNVTLPDSVRFINGSAFAYDTALTSIYIPQDMQNIHTSAFSAATDNVVLNVAEDTYAETFAKSNKLNYTTREKVLKVVDTGNCGTNVSWTLYEGGNLVISGNGAMTDLSNDKLQPWKIYSGRINKIVIGNGITHIGDWSFAYMTGVTSVKFEDNSSLKSLGIGAFLYDLKLTDIVLPESLKTIGASAFNWDSALKNVFIPQSVDSMGGSVFANCSKVTLNVAESTYSERYARDNKIPYVTRECIPVVLYSGTCGQNVTWTLYDNGKLYIDGNGAMTDLPNDKAQPWKAHSSKITSIVIGKNITHIGDWTFAYQVYAESVTFEQNSKLESIGVGSFLYMLKLTSITLPESLSSIGASAFNWNSALTSVFVPQGVMTIGSNAFAHAPSTVLNVAKTTVAETYAKNNNLLYIAREYVPVTLYSGDCGENAKWTIYDNGELVISGSGAMADLSNDKAQPWYAYRYLVNTVVVGKDITHIGNWSFAYMTQVKNIRFAEDSNLTSIGSAGFLYMLGVTEVTLPATLKTIGGSAFAWDNALKSVSVPSSVTSIASNAFTGADKLVLNVASGSYAEQFAVSKSIAYKTV